ncbi:hypothetical protein RsTz2092_07540 [Deferribacterales bacterium RsTz2092]|nr:hypothetical protein AGMMS49941_01490 [Deferribacterales bacterium]
MNIKFNNSAGSSFKSSSGIYVWGVFEVGMLTARFLIDSNLPFRGFIDSYNYGKTINLAGDGGQLSYRVARIEDIADKNAHILISSVTHYAAICDMATANGFNNIVDPLDIIEHSDANHELITSQYGLGLLWLADDYARNKQKYDDLDKILADDRSRIVLNAIVSCCNVGTYELNKRMGTVDDGLSKQYEEFMKGDIFVDGGCFDGGSSEAFIKLNPNYKKIYAFEPDPLNMSVCKSNLAKYSNIEYLHYGLADKEKTLKFNGTGGQVGAFADDGNISVECVALDALVKEDKVFIKLDVEGLELDAIAGAKRLLTNGSPFAICVYHKSGDIWKIPERILGYNPNYKLYLRKYGLTFGEIVLFGIA